MAIEREVTAFSARKPRTAVELVDQLAGGDLGRSWLNIEPGVTPEVAARFEQSPLGRAFSGRGPGLASVTITCADAVVSVGIEHGRGPKAVEFLAERGVVVPPEWTVLSDHAKSGLVFAAPDPIDGRALVDFSVDAVRALSPSEFSDEWFIAVVGRR